MGALVLKLNEGPLFARTPMHIKVLGSAAPKLALVTVSRYNCDVKLSYVDVCAKFH